MIYRNLAVTYLFTVIYEKNYFSGTIEKLIKKDCPKWSNKEELIDVKGAVKSPYQENFQRKKVQSLEPLAINFSPESTTAV